MRSKNENIRPDTMNPDQIYILSTYFGVGYSSLINHLHFSFNFISKAKMKQFLRIPPRKIKERYGGVAGSEVIIVDHLWIHRAVDLELGDTVILPPDTLIKDGF